MTKLGGKLRAHAPQTTRTARCDQNTGKGHMRRSCESSARVYDIGLQPTLNPGEFPAPLPFFSDYVFVNKMAVQRGVLERGDVITLWCVITLCPSPSTTATTHTPPPPRTHTQTAHVGTLAHRDRSHCGLTRTGTCYDGPDTKSVPFPCCGAGHPSRTTRC